MKPELRRFGTDRHPVVVIDQFSGEIDRILGIAEALAPFPRLERNYYPGVRRIISRADAEADDYVERTCQDAAKFIAGAFDFPAFDLIEASFSVVSVRPGELRPPQRAPHFDSTDSDHLALLHYLRVPAGTGTGFFRHRATGIERVTEANVGRFVPIAAAQAAGLPHAAGYIQGSDAHFEMIGMVEAVPDRLVIYQGGLLHSGLIPPGMTLDPDPRAGRLTANIFVRGHGRN